MAGVMKTLVWMVFSCIHCLFWTPIVIVTAAIIWGYYVYIYLINVTAAGEGDILEKPLALRIVLMIVAHVLLFLQYTSFIKAIITKHTPVPQQYHLTQEQLRELDDAEDEKEYLTVLVKKLPISVQMISRSGGVRYCPRCRLIKPDRCHHCSLCNRCVLKMDHHCPWINNCVGHSNYKFFFLFLLYTMVLCLFIGLSSIYDVVGAWTHHGNRGFDLSWVRFNTVFLFFVCLIFAAGVGFLFFFHIYLVLTNKTTLESGRTPDFVFKRDCGNAYNLGWRKNLQQIFGTNLFIGLLPLSSSLGDGCNFLMGYKARGMEEPLQDGRLIESDEELYNRESTPLTVP